MSISIHIAICWFIYLSIDLCVWCLSDLSLFLNLYFFFSLSLSVSLWFFLYLFLCQYHLSVSLSLTLCLSEFSLSTYRSVSLSLFLTPLSLISIFFLSLSLSFWFLWFLCSLLHARLSLSSALWSWLLVARDAIAMRDAIQIVHPQIASDAQKFYHWRCGNPLARLIWIHRKRATKIPAKILRCWSAMRKIGIFLRSSDAKCLWFGHSLRSGLRCERPRCQIASDVGRAMRSTKSWLFASL